ncbi:MAG: PEGA domain-containing protein [Planctomycetota bacterium]
MFLCLHKPNRGAAAVLVALVALLATSGCVRRRLTVRTNPPGALVYVDNQQIGTSPCSVDFTYYGTREIRMVKPGYETLTINQPIPSPWWQKPGIDFVSENLVPLKIRDNRQVSFNLIPQRIIPTEELIGRGQQLRVEAQAPPAVVPAGALLPVASPRY